MNTLNPALWLFPCYNICSMTLTQAELFAELFNMSQNDRIMCCRIYTYSSKCHLIIHHGEEYVFKISLMEKVILFSAAWGSGDSYLKWGYTLAQNMPECWNVIHDSSRTRFLYFIVEHVSLCCRLYLRVPPILTHLRTSGCVDPACFTLVRKAL